MLSPRRNTLFGILRLLGEERSLIERLGSHVLDFTDRTCRPKEFPLVRLGQCPVFEEMDVGKQLSVLWTSEIIAQSLLGLMELGAKVVEVPSSVIVQVVHEVEWPEPPRVVVGQEVDSVAPLVIVRDLGISCSVEDVALGTVETKPMVMNFGDELTSLVEASD